MECVEVEFNTVAGAVCRDGFAVLKLKRVLNVVVQTKAMDFEE